MPIKYCSKCGRLIAAMDVYDPLPAGPVCSRCMLQAAPMDASGPDLEPPNSSRIRPRIPWSSFLDILAR